MSMHVDLEDGVYKNKLPLPEKPKKPEVLWKIAQNLTYEEVTNLQETVRQYEEAVTAYELARTLFYGENSRLYNKFRADALEYVGLKDHPKADKAFAMAWDRGHSSGYSEVLNELEDLAELLL